MTNIKIPTASCARCHCEGHVQPLVLTRLTGPNAQAWLIAYDDDGGSWMCNASPPSGWKQSPVGILCDGCYVQWQRAATAFLKGEVIEAAPPPALTNAQPMPQLAKPQTVFPSQQINSVSSRPTITRHIEPTPVVSVSRMPLPTSSPMSNPVPIVRPMTEIQRCSPVATTIPVAISQTREPIPAAVAASAAAPAVMAGKVTPTPSPAPEPVRVSRNPGESA